METYHVPALLTECIEHLRIKPGGIYVDVTYGGGGHSREILKYIDKGKLYAFDQDADAAANVIDDDRLVFTRCNFRYMGNYLRFYKVRKVDGIIADLGVSSHHFDEQERGFSYRLGGELDMRMNKDSKLTACDVLNDYDEKKLTGIFEHYGEIQRSRQMVNLIVGQRKVKRIKTIEEFTHAIEPIIPKHQEYKILAKIFQALRIEVNGELDVLKEFLEQTVDFVAKGGRLAIITYHSLEDRIVKNFMRTGSFEAETKKDFYGNVISPFVPVNKKVIIPRDDEIALNPRIRSAKLRVGERI